MSPSDLDLARLFSGIYEHGSWNAVDQTIRSGEGSAPKLNTGYIKLLQEFIRKPDVTSVVDVGCGDWSFSRLIDWSSVDYLGIDIVPEVIENLTRRYARDNIRFVQANFVTCELLTADLLLAKDVLQHLPNELIMKFLGKLRGFKYAILTNDRRKTEPRSWRRLWLSVQKERTNSDITPAHYRPVRLREPPFNLDATELMRINMRHSNGTHVKEVLLWQNMS